MSDAVAAATQLRPASPRDGADRFIPTGTNGVLALGHDLGRGLEAAFAHVIHVRDERIASLEWVTGTPSWPHSVPPATG
jgi:hypothetical protein